MSGTLVNADRVLSYALNHFLKYFHELFSVDSSAAAETEAGL